MHWVYIRRYHACRVINLMGNSATVDTIVPARIFTSVWLRFRNRAIPCDLDFGTMILLVTAKDCLVSTVIDNPRAGTAPVTDTDSTDWLAVTGMTTRWVCDSGNMVNVTCGTNKPATTKTAMTPAVKISMRPSRDVRHVASFSCTISRILRRSRRGVFGIRLLLGAESGQGSR